MQTNNTNQLIKILEAKEIKFKLGEKALFKKYNYYQVINAYKNLFLRDIEDINNIKNNIQAGINIEFYRNTFRLKRDIPQIDLYEKSCDSICKKYGVNGNTLSEKEQFITEIMYHHHLYKNDTSYGEFVRMYKFEHELRLMLLKYTLIIEECIKNIFVSYLNDEGASADYLTNMTNYNTSSIKSKAFSTMKLIIEKHDNLKSKPIERKRNQNLTIPYWILINELAMNQTYYAMWNLNEKDSKAIFIKCTNFFANKNIKLDNRGKTRKQIEKEEKSVATFKSILNYLGEFRNMLAHNQPIYCFNISKFDISILPAFEYEFPRVDHQLKDSTGALIPKLTQQHRLNKRLMYCLEDFFGADNFNFNKTDVNLNLSLIIYILFKILNNIDKNNQFYEELIEIYKKYNIILSHSEYEISNPNEYLNLLEQINNVPNSIDVNDVIERIETNSPYKMELKKYFRDIKNREKKIVTLSHKIKISEKKSKYDVFSSAQRYTEFTGIDLNYFNNIK